MLLPVLSGPGLLSPRSEGISRALSLEQALQCVAELHAALVHVIIDGFPENVISFGDLL